MIGAGIFSAAGPASAAAGGALLVAVVIAGCLALLNALAMAQLASVYPESGGTYIYGRKRLGNYWGFLAGWGFVIGKLASCSAMALTFANYAAPEFARPIAISSVFALALVNFFGIKKTALVTKTLVTIVLSALAIVVFAAIGGGGADPSRLWHITEDVGFFGILQAAGLMFFAFAGYARIATLGEEVIDPKNTIPKAILTALGTTVLIYLIVISTAMMCVDTKTLSLSTAPLVIAVESGHFFWLSPLVRIGACFAALGVLLSLLAGVSRTTFAMAANNDLPKFLSAVHPIHKVPHVAELVVGIIVALIVSVADVRTSIGFSSFAVLIYYAIANAAAWTLSPKERKWPKWLCGFGFIFCAVIAFSLPFASVVGGVILFAAGTLYFFWNK